jgi:AmiR/NasT family two-component response regulator
MDSRRVRLQPDRDPMPHSADVVVLSTTRLIRAPLRAQLIEDGFEVIGTATWSMMRRHLRPGTKPRLVIVDLQDLPDADQVLRDLRLLMPPDRVLVLAAPASIAADQVERLGYVALRRPIAIGDIVDAARALRARVLSGAAARR